MKILDDNALTCVSGGQVLLTGFQTGESGAVPIITGGVAVNAGAHAYYGLSNAATRTIHNKLDLTFDTDLNFEITTPQP
ncbi:MAG: hypothetical protein K0Q74_134 [Gammaproteobacteria bacterium]|jgi:hypothetical protein|nr:hypothetical protein [Gammaproteobacteria bacterium]